MVDRRGKTKMRRSGWQNVHLRHHRRPTDMNKYCRQFFRRSTLGYVFRKCIEHQQHTSPCPLCCVVGPEVCRTTGRRSITLQNISLTSSSGKKEKGSSTQLSLINQPQTQAGTQLHTCNLMSCLWTQHRLCVSSMSPFFISAHSCGCLSLCSPVRGGRS